MTVRTPALTSVTVGYGNRICERFFVEDYLNGFLICVVLNGPAVEHSGDVDKTVHYVDIGNLVVDGELMHGWVSVVL